MLVGPSRLGKTEWARSLGQHIYQTGIWDPSVWTSVADYLVVDDLGFQYLGGLRKGIWGAQEVITVGGKFAHNRQVQWGKPLIFCCNPGEDFRYMFDKSGRNSLLSDSERDWYEQNSVIVNVSERMY